MRLAISRSNKESLQIFLESGVGEEGLMVCRDIISGFMISIPCQLKPTSKFPLVVLCYISTIITIIYITINKIPKNNN